MNEEEAVRLTSALRRHRPEIKAAPWRNGMTNAYEVAVNGGDPRGIRLWLKSPRQVMRYIAWLSCSEQRQEPQP